MASDDAADGKDSSEIAGAPVLRAAYYVVTRFNLYKEQFRENLSDSDYERWCAVRAEMLMNITAPSLINQSSKSFRWLILCDVELNRATEAMIDALKALEFAEIIFIDLRDKLKRKMQAAISDHIKQKLSKRYTHVSTTRLDSDDAIHVDFIKSLRSRVSHSAGIIHGQDLVRVQFPYLMTWDGNHFRVGQYPRGHFATLIEPNRRRQQLKTVYCFNHTTKMAGDLYVHNKFPSALTCVHGGNLWNTFNDVDLEVLDDGSFLREFGIDEARAKASLLGE